MKTQRQGNFSSSEIYKLIPMGSRPMDDIELAYYKEMNPKGKKKNIDAGFAKPGLTYIQEKRFELLCPYFRTAF